MFIRKKKKADEYSVVVYKKDLSVDLNRILFSGKSEGLKEYVYVPHFDASEEHYHIYLRFEKRVSEDVVDKLFFKTKCFISSIPSHETALSLLHYFTEGFRLTFESNYSAKIEELRRINK